MGRLGRKKAQQWLAPLRKAIRTIRTTGDVTEADGHPVMELPDAFARIDYCVAGFSGVIRRVAPGASLVAVAEASRKLTDGQGMTVAEVDAALAELNAVEPLIARASNEQIRDAVITEQIVIELEAA